MEGEITGQLGLSLAFILGSCLILFVGAYTYYTWRATFYRRPSLARTQVSLEIDDSTIYLHQIASITEEYVYSMPLLMWGFILGFSMYLMFFFLNDFRSQSEVSNVVLSICLTCGGGLLAYIMSLDKKTVIRDSSGKTHELTLPDVERLEFKQEVTKDVWKMMKNT